MATIATQRVCDAFMSSSTAQELELSRITIEGQMTAEKNLSWGNILRTRGVRVIVWGSIFDHECQKILGCTTRSLYQTIINSKEAVTRNGKSGYNIDCANVIAAMFIACGQDAASVAEGSANQMTIEYDWETKKLKLSSYMASLPVGNSGWWNCVWLPTRDIGAAAMHRARE